MLQSVKDTFVEETIIKWIVEAEIKENEYEEKPFVQDTVEWEVIKDSTNESKDAVDEKNLEHCSDVLFVKKTLLGKKTLKRNHGLPYCQIVCGRKLTEANLLWTEGLSSSFHPMSHFLCQT